MGAAQLLKESSPNLGNVNHTANNRQQTTDKTAVPWLTLPVRKWSEIKNDFLSSMCDSSITAHHCEGSAIDVDMAASHVQEIEAASSPWNEMARKTPCESQTDAHSERKENKKTKRKGKKDNNETKMPTNSQKKREMKCQRQESMHSAVQCPRKNTSTIPEHKLIDKSSKRDRHW